MVLKPSTHQDLVKTGLPRKGVEQLKNDQVSSDLARAKEAGSKIVGRVKEAVTPVISQNKQTIQTTLAPAKGMFANFPFKKIARIVAVVLLLLVLLYIVSLFVKTIRQNGEVTVSGIPTPTVAPYIPYNPSVYAEDELVLQLEEDIKVLDRELATAQLKETILTPPVLDFKVNFEE